ncbi:MAG: glutamate--tRNA ligase family protein [Bacteroidota bacterium]
MNFRTRIAPTPSGFLHSGNIYSFQLTAQLAAETGAEILLRIDDLDAARKRPEYVANIFETLHTLGIRWQLGPQTPDDFENNWSQHLRLPLYNETLQQLRQHEGLVYVCTCSRRELDAANGTCNCKNNNLPFDTPDTAWRVAVEPGTVISFNDLQRGKVEIDLAETTGDFVVRRRDGIPAYQIASLTDDVHFGITHIVRGEDLLPSTAAQLFLAEKLGLTSFLQSKFLHHALITDESGLKLSKSNLSQQH